MAINVYDFVEEANGNTSESSLDRVNYGLQEGFKSDNITIGSQQDEELSKNLKKVIDSSPSGYDISTHLGEADIVSTMFDIPFKEAYSLVKTSSLVDANVTDRITEKPNAYNAMIDSAKSTYYSMRAGTNFSKYVAKGDEEYKQKAMDFLEKSSQFKVGEDDWSFAGNLLVGSGSAIGSSISADIGTTAIRLSFSAAALLMPSLAPALLAAGKWGSRAYGFYQAGSSQAGLQALELSLEKDSNGNSIDIFDPKVKALLGINFFAQGLIEMVGLELNPGYKKMVSALGRKTIADISKSTLKSFGTQYITNTALSILDESSEELMQTYAGDLADNMIKAYSNKGGTDFELKSLRDTTVDAFTAFGQTAKDMILFSMFTTGLGTTANEVSMRVQANKLQSGEADNVFHREIISQSMPSEMTNPTPVTSKKTTTEPTEKGEQEEDNSDLLNSDGKYQTVNIIKTPKGGIPATEKDARIISELDKKNKTVNYGIRANIVGETKSVATQNQLDVIGTAINAKKDNQGQFAFDNQEDFDTAQKYLENNLFVTNKKVEGNKVNYSTVDDSGSKLDFSIKLAEEGETLSDLGAFDQDITQKVSPLKSEEAFFQNEEKRLVSNYILEKSPNMDKATLQASTNATIALFETLGLNTDEALGKNLDLELSEAPIGHPDARGWFDRSEVEFNKDGSQKFKIHITKNANPTTIIHEAGHVLSYALGPDVMNAFAEAYNGVAGEMWVSDIKKTADGKYTLGSKIFDTYDEAFEQVRDFEERFADDAIEYFKKDIAPTPATRSIFQKLKEFIRKLLGTNQDKLSAKTVRAFQTVLNQARTATGARDTQGSTLFQSGDKKTQNREEVLENFVKTHGKNVLFQEEKSYKDTEKALRADTTRFNSKGEHLAPNGKKSNLPYNLWVSVHTPEFKNWFGDWENDPENASKVVDDNGEPLVVYHGTDKDFSEFDTKTGSNRKTKQQLDFGSHFSEESYAKGYSKTGKLMNVFLNIKNPLNLAEATEAMQYKGQRNFDKLVNLNKLLGIKPLSENFRDINGVKQKTQQSSFINQFLLDSKTPMKVKASIQEAGFDGLIYEPYNRTGLSSLVRHPVSYIAFEPTQIKSVENQGTWDKTNPNILYQEGQGYDYDKWMSVNAVQSYESGQKPISKWTKGEMIDFISLIDEDKAEVLKKLPVKALRKHFLTNRGWHHTGRFYTETNFYSLNQSLIEDFSVDELQKFVEDYNKFSTYEKEKKAYIKNLKDGQVVVTDSGEKATIKKPYYYLDTSEKYDKIIENMGSKTMAFLKQASLDDESNSGNIYERGRKPSTLQYRDPNYFKEGEKRAKALGDYYNRGYELQEYKNGKWDTIEKTKEDSRLEPVEPITLINYIKTGEPVTHRVEMEYLETKDMPKRVAEPRLENSTLYQLSDEYKQRTSMATEERVKKALESQTSWVPSYLLENYASQEWAREELKFRKQTEFLSQSEIDYITSFASREDYIKDVREKYSEDVEIDEDNLSRLYTYYFLKDQTPDKLDKKFVDKVNNMSDEEFVAFAQTLNKGFLSRRNNQSKFMFKLSDKYPSYAGISTKVLALNENSTSQEISTARDLIAKNPSPYRWVLFYQEQAGKSKALTEGQEFPEQFLDELAREDYYREIRERKESEKERRVAKKIAREQRKKDLDELTRDSLKTRETLERLMLENETIPSLKAKLEKLEKTSEEYKKLKTAYDALVRSNEIKEAREARESLIKNIKQRSILNNLTLDASFEPSLSFIHSLFDKRDRREINTDISSTIAEINRLKLEGNKAYIAPLERELGTLRALRDASEMVDVPEQFAKYLSHTLKNKATQIKRDNRQSKWTIEELEQISQALDLMRDEAKAMYSQKVADRMQKLSNAMANFVQQHTDETLDPEDVETRNTLNTFINSTFADYDSSPKTVIKKMKTVFRSFYRGDFAQGPGLSKWLDGWQEGVLYEWLNRRALDCETKQLDNSHKRWQKLDDYLKENGYNHKNLYADFMTYTTPTGDVTLTLGEAIGVYCLSLNGPEAIIKLQGVNGNQIPDIVKIVEALPAKDKALGDFLIETIGGDDVWERMSDVYYRVYNKNLGRRQNYMTFKPATPIASQDNDFQTDFLVSASGNPVKYVEKGMTKEINPNAVYKLDLDVVSLVHSQIKRQEHFMAWCEWARDMNYMLNSNLGTSISRIYGRDTLNTVQNLVNRYTSPNESLTRFQKLANIVISNVAVSDLLLNPVSAMKQFASLTGAVRGDISLKAFSETLTSIGKNPIQTIEFVNNMSPYMKDRTFAIAVADYKKYSEKGELSTLTGKFNEKYGMKMVEFNDKLIASIIWLSRYKTAIDKEGATVEEATFQANMTVRETQSTSNVLDRSEMQAKQSPFVKTILLFTNDAIKMANQMAFNLPYYWKQKNYKKLIGVAMNILLQGAVVTLIGGAFFKREGDDDNEKKRRNRIIIALIAQYGDDLIPLFGRIMQSSLSGYFGGTAQALEPAQDIGTLARKIIQYEGTDEQKESLKNSLIDSLFDLATVSALPVVETKRIIKAFKNENALELLGPSYADLISEDR